jgi:predicted transcriptional regulator
MKTSSNTGSTSARTKVNRAGKIRVGVEPADSFFSRMRTNARRLDRSETLPPSTTVSFEDPADVLDVITPARLRLLQAIGKAGTPLFTLATSLSRDPSAVRRDVTLLESKHLVKTRKVSNPGHGVQTVVERIAATITLAATV